MYLVETYGQLFPANLVVVHQGGLGVQGVVVHAFVDLHKSQNASFKLAAPWGRSLPRNLNSQHRPATCHTLNGFQQP